MTEPTFLTTVDSIARDVVARHATAVDKEARFPTEALEALKSAGLFALTSDKSVGGMGYGIREAALVVERLARECSSTAMILCMHYAGTAVIEKFGSEAVRRDVVAGRHLSTLAFSEAGSRSHFWAPLSTATRDGDSVRINAKKSWITSASHATAYVWSSRPASAEGFSTLWLVPRNANGLRSQGPFDGLGLRGNDSLPVTAEDVLLTDADRLGDDGKGFDVMMGVVLPIFNAMNAACSVGIMEAAITRSAAHVGGTRLEHAQNSALAELATIRAYLAKSKVRADMARTLWLDTLTALETGRADAQLRVLECKAACADAALEVTDTAMRVCGGAAFRKDVGVERFFRDARAASVMGPTSDVLYDFIGKAVCGLPLF